MLPLTDAEYRPEHGNAMRTPADEVNQSQLAAVLPLEDQNSNSSCIVAYDPEPGCRRFHSVRPRGAPQKQNQNEKLEQHHPAPSLHGQTQSQGCWAANNLQSASSSSGAGAEASVGARGYVDTPYPEPGAAASSLGKPAKSNPGAHNPAGQRSSVPPDALALTHGLPHPPAPLSLSLPPPTSEVYQCDEHGNIYEPCQAAMKKPSRHFIPDPQDEDGGDVVRLVTEVSWEEVERQDDQLQQQQQQPPDRFFSSTAGGGVGRTSAAPGEGGINRVQMHELDSDADGKKNEKKNAVAARAKSGSGSSSASMPGPGPVPGPAPAVRAGAAAASAAAAGPAAAAGTYASVCICICIADAIGFAIAVALSLRLMPMRIRMPMQTRSRTRPRPRPAYS